jgi:hypothetical protein
VRKILVRRTGLQKRRRIHIGLGSPQEAQKPLRDSCSRIPDLQPEVPTKTAAFWTMPPKRAGKLKQSAAEQADEEELQRLRSRRAVRRGLVTRVINEIWEFQNSLEPDPDDDPAPEEEPLLEKAALTRLEALRRTLTMRIDALSEFDTGIELLTTGGGALET